MVAEEADTEEPHLANDGEYVPDGNEVRLCAVARRQKGFQAKCRLAETQDR
jgi:hypothetical protein